MLEKIIKNFYHYFTFIFCTIKVIILSDLLHIKIIMKNHNIFYTLSYGISY
jgi:hypothetical protein